MPLALRNGTAPATPAAGKVYLYTKSDKNAYIKDEDGTEKQITTASASTVYTGTCDGRLTLTTALPVTTADVSAATTIYFTPTGKGGQVALYTAAVWTLYTLTERSLSLSGLTTTQPYDIFLYDSSGTLTLEAVAWASNTARTTNIVMQNGVYCKTGALDRRYVGTIKMQATGQCEDSKLRRFVWNMYNREQRVLKVVETTNTWTYATAAWGSLNGSTANRVEFVIGVAESPVLLTHNILATSQTAYAGIALDATNTSDADIKTASLSLSTTSQYYQMIAIGYHFLQLTQYAAAATATIFGDNNTPTILQTGGLGSIAA